MFRKNETTSRTTFQDTRIEDLTLTGKVESSSIRVRINFLEEARGRSRQIKAMLGTNWGTGVTKGHTTDETTNVITKHSTKTAIEQANIEYLPELFLCTNNTPLRTSPLLEEFGYTGDTIAGDAVTEGTHVPPSNTD